MIERKPEGNNMKKRLFDEEIARMDRREVSDKRAVKRMVDRVLACVGKRVSYSRKADVAKELGRRWIPLFGESLTEHVFLHNLMDGFMEGVIAPKIKEALDLIWKGQKEGKDSYGDADYWFTKYLDNKKVRVSLLKDSVCCRDTDRYIIIEDKVRGRTHIRVIVQEVNSDYPKERYPKRLCLKFFEDRGFVMEYQESLHMTNKGGVYGDIRDTGYVLSFGGEGFSNRVEKALHFYNDLEHVTWLLGCMVEELKSGGK